MARAKAKVGTTIVLTKVESELLHDGKPYAADLGQRPRLIERPRVLAVVWANKATLRDLASATAYAERDGWTLHIMSSSERDPLGSARAKVHSSL